jgi:hypothetical protein
MTSLYGRCIGVFALICVLALFFFPLMQGPFQATHGPTTALRSKRAFLILLLTIMMAALQLVSVLFPILLRTFRVFIGDNNARKRWSLAGCDGILRC